MIAKRLIFRLICLFSLLPLFSIAQQVTVPVGTQESFANGEIQGHWQLYKTWDKETGTYGQRGDLSMYNPKTNTLYVITSGKNLVMGELQPEGFLDLRNQKIYLQGKVFLGIQKPDGAFRLIAGVAVSADQSNLHYSDDEGMSWKESFGGRFSGSDSYWGTILEGHNNQVLALVKQAIFVNGVWSFQWALLQSNDLGKSYQTLRSWSNEDFESVIAQRSLNTEDCYFITRQREENQWQVILYKPDNNQFQITLPDTLSAVPVAMTATTIHDTTHLFAACDNNDLMYSQDMGKTWIKRSSDPKWKQLYTADPRDSKKLYCKTTHLHLSKDGGLSLEELPYWWAEFGWDVKTANWFKNIGGEWFMVLNNDFGTFYAKDPHERLAWHNMNQGNTHQMDHHGASWDATDLLVTGNQDRGTFVWTKVGKDSLFARTAQKADGLRVCISNNGMAYWFIHYWTTMHHRHAPITGDPRLAETQLTKRTVKNWYTPPMKPSWIPGEDAIYLAGEPKLMKLTYQSDSNKIVKKDIAFDFKAASGEVCYGLETTPLDTNRMYVVTKNGQFFYTHDGGKNWSKTAYTGSVPSATQRRTWGLVGYAVEAADMNPDLVYWSGIGGKGYIPFLVSQDGGITFRSATKGLPANTRIDGIAVTPNGDYVFGTNGYVYIRSENKWHEMKGLSYPLAGNINGVDYLADSEIIRYYTYGLGVMDFVLDKAFRGLDLQYYDNPRLKGDPLSFSKAATINLDIGPLAPKYNFGQINNFGLRWTGNMKAPVSGKYTFTTQVADGVKFWLNNKLLINSWKEQDSITYSADIMLDSGQVYPLTLDYFNGRGVALVKLFWEYPGQKKQIVPAKVFVQEASGFTPKLQYFPYDLTAISDGNGAIVEWREPEFLHPAGNNKMQSNKQSGSLFQDGLSHVNYTVTTDQKMQLEKSFDVLVYEASKLKATYYEDTIPGGKEILTRYEPFIDYEWLREIPHTDPLVRDTFSVRWEGEVYAPATGEYFFSIRGESGAQLYLNDSLMIDAWKGKSGKWATTKISFEKNVSIRIRMDYYHKRDFVTAKLYWKVPGTRYQLVRFKEE
ncbi:MAG: hypothetical protein J7L96_03060 [Bacteroidales bacterium]|nr:hypothetical protein [Bacteroidales bacterium]